MNIHIINSPSDQLYSEFSALYATSFPIFEQRTASQQAEAFASEEYRLLAYCEENRLIGFVSYWEFPEYIYIEHLAINTALRGRGYGSKMLAHFLDMAQKCTLLEIDPITDEVSAARLNFYSRCGFYKNPYSHIHPPYRSEFKGHPLIVLSSGAPLPESLYETFYQDLQQKVMKFQFQERSNQ